ncbi:3-oxoacyl-ACP reductase [Clostridium thermosuccinogenes]|uniref:3-oxoacyl-ACP reductase n=1 Tax=Clostridium thermosuccinogenes TaxID=84032 RepID=A0A2K2FCJ7_9CLOT|nr:SDR family oxidoreductase [Pseudoclostridium thermosuccinogenes]AUS95536.1 3-oxoacyl-ACP reductase [Pseudoclostridium thermosuccinogenes]PNT96510.1 3-oxoacyl-ACP reductase [Pseudoclostridium thermosuccinogenes]PNT98253.1 3-oxoacyl-ACP reductase [Pseudoclostridium thermosuccinogenes]
MKTAILTGASRGIGLEIVKRLIAMDYRVYGLARSFESTDFSHENFVPVQCDVQDTEKLIKAVGDIEEKEPEIHLLVNNAGLGYFGPHEQIPVKGIQAMVRTNLEAPLILCRLLLRSLKKSRGTIISISSVTAKKISTHGCAYAATKAGLSHFLNSLFEEVRKYGVKVTTIHPDMTKTGFYDNLDFTYEEEADAVLMAEQVADAVEYVLRGGDNLVINDITLRPQKNRIRRKTAKRDDGV